MTASHNYDTWRKSSYSQPDSNCVEVALDPQTARVRDTKRPEAGHIEASPTSWRALLERL